MDAISPPNNVKATPDDLSLALRTLQRGVVFSCLAIVVMVVSASLMWPLMEAHPWIRDAVRVAMAICILGTLYHLITAIRPVQAGASAVHGAARLRQLSIQGVKDYAIFMLDPDGRIVNWNDGAQAITGYTAEEAIGKHFSCFYPAEDISAGKPQSELQRATEQGMVEDEGWRIRKDGSRYWSNVIITAIREDNGKILGFTKVTRAITEQKREEARLAALLEAAPDAMVVVNKDGKIVLGNSQVERTFGYKQEELLQQDIDILVPGRLRAAHASLRAMVFEEPVFRPTDEGMELYAIHKDGHEFPVEVTMSPLETEDGLLVSSAIRDVTERKKIDLAIRALNRDLEKRNADLDSVNKELEAFTYSVAHDLRAPLRHIHGFARILAEDYGQSFEPDARELLQDIQKGADRMGSLIDDLLNLSRIVRREVRFQIAGLRSIVDDIIAEQALETSGRQVCWQIDELPFVECDPGLIKQVYSNLITNALKYTRPRKVAEITVGKMQTEDGTVFFVRDNGVGFNMKYADKLFGVFQRLHRSEDFEGTGVGLATVQRIIQKHNGRIWAEAEVDKGATFYFTLGQPDEPHTEEPELVGSEIGGTL